MLLQADRFWGELCDVMGHPELKDDPRFVDMGVRFQNREECVRTLDEIFGAATLEEWKERLENFSGVWAPVLSVQEVHSIRRSSPNGYLPTLTDNDGVDVPDRRRRRCRSTTSRPCRRARPPSSASTPS